MGDRSFEVAIRHRDKLHWVSEMRTLAEAWRTIDGDALLAGEKIFDSRTDVRCSKMSEDWRSMISALDSSPAFGSCSHPSFLVYLEDSDKRQDSDRSQLYGIK